MAIIWFSVAYSGSRARWNLAIEARKRALTAALESVDSAGIRAIAKSEAAGVLAALDQKIADIASDNKEIVGMTEGGEHNQLADAFR